MTDPHVENVNMKASGQFSTADSTPFRGGSLVVAMDCGAIQLRIALFLQLQAFWSFEMHLTQVLQPQLCISLAQIAKFLGIPETMICRYEHWPHQLFVHRQDRGGQFISYRVFMEWIEACAKSIQACTDLRVLQWLGEIIRLECQRFTYPESVLEHWRQLWRQQHYQLRIGLCRPPILKEDPEFCANPVA
ncbi:hypothetical protein [Leptolyngbya sp. FACHB-261]|uniref:hypothetical protein n=1 Tax=Leptolyngbya sp. FACHB-261 TaxID=2692806 RepID=UPI00168794E2|nr:hypothetical protein [Leptolyngbya sp. FACHB-261]MBD2103334.1 hypothetical protein [Leptolyngbya sp. FACHB-261]